MTNENFVFKYECSQYASARMGNSVGGDSGGGNYEVAPFVMDVTGSRIYSLLLF